MAGQLVENRREKRTSVRSLLLSTCGKLSSLKKSLNPMSSRAMVNIDLCFIYLVTVGG